MRPVSLVRKVRCAGALLHVLRLKKEELQEVLVLPWRPMYELLAKLYITPVPSMQGKHTISSGGSRVYVYVRVCAVLVATLRLSSVMNGVQHLYTDVWVARGGMYAPTLVCCHGSTHVRGCPRSKVSSFVARRGPVVSRV